MKTAVLLYPGVEPIDLATIGVLSMARRVIPSLETWTIGVESELVVLSSGLRVAAEYSLTQSPAFDVLIVPGGPGWVDAVDDERLLKFLRLRAKHTTLVSVCTGAMLLARAGVLDGLGATTKVEVTGAEIAPLSILESDYPSVNTRHALIVDNGKVLTGGGVSLCIDTILYLLEREFGAGSAAEVSRILEYGAAQSANRKRLATITMPAVQT